MDEKELPNLQNKEPASWFNKLSDMDKQKEIMRHQIMLDNLIKYKLELIRLRTHNLSLPSKNVTNQNIDREMKFVDSMLTIITLRSKKIGQFKQTSQNLVNLRELINQIRGLNP